MPPWEIPGKVGEFDEDWRVATLNSHNLPRHFKIGLSIVLVNECNHYDLLLHNKMRIFENVTVFPNPDTLDYVEQCVSFCCQSSLAILLP